MMPSNHLILCHPLLLLPSIFPSISVFSNESTLRMRWPKYWSFSFSISPSSESSGWSSCSPRDSQEYSPTPRLKSTNSSALSLLYGPTLTSIHDYWKNHSFDYTDLCQQSDVLAFNSLSRLVSFSSKEQATFNFMAAVTIHSELGAQENKVCHCFHCFPIYLPWSDGLVAMILAFWMLSFKPIYSLSSFTFIKELFSSSLIFAIRVLSSAYLRLLIFLS